MVPRRFILSRNIILFPVFKFAFSSLNAESLVVEGKKDHTYLAKSAREFSFQLAGILLFSIRLAVRVTMIHVLAVGAGVREALEALGALEGLFAAVQSLVFGQMVLVLERPWALHAFVRPLPCGYSSDLLILFTSRRPKCGL